MKTKKSSSVFVTAFLFIISLALFFAIKEIINLDNIENPTLYDQIPHYFFLFTTCLLSAIIISNIVKSLFCNFISKKLLKVQLPQIFEDFIVVFSFILVFFGIFLTQIDQAFNGMLISFALILLVIGTLFFRKFSMTLEDFSNPSNGIFQIDDHIEIISNFKTVKGKVVDFSNRFIKIQNETNENISIPNNILDKSIINTFSDGNTKIYNEISLTLNITVEPAQIIRITKAALTEVQRLNNQFLSDDFDVLINEIKNSQVIYSITYFLNKCNDFNISEMKSQIYFSIKNHFNKAGLDFSKITNQNLVAGSDLSHELEEKQRITKIISQNSLFSCLNNDELSKIVNQVIYHEFYKNEVIINQNESGNSMFILLEGLLDVYLIDDSAKKINVGMLSPGDFFGEMSLLTGETRAANVKSIADSLVIEIKKEHINSIITDRTELLDGFSKVIAERQSQNIDFLESAKSEKGYFDKILNKMKSFFHLK